MDRPVSLAAAIENAAESLIDVLDGAVTVAAAAVSPTQLRVLALIDRRPGTNLNRLAERLDVVPSSASRLCDRLEATGLVRRIVDVTGKREVLHAEHVVLRVEARPDDRRSAEPSRRTITPIQQQLPVGTRGDDVGVAVIVEVVAGRRLRGPVVLRSLRGGHKPYREHRRESDRRAPAQQPRRASS